MSLYFDRLLTKVPPPVVPAFAGSVDTWEKIKKQVELPESLFEFYHTYGSGVFAVFDNRDSVRDLIYILNVFEESTWESTLDDIRLDGIGFTEQNTPASWPAEFYPINPRGLFPVTRSDQGIFLLIDPTDSTRVIVTETWLSFFDVVACGLDEFLFRSFTGDLQTNFCMVTGGAPFGHVAFYADFRRA